MSYMTDPDFGSESEADFVAASSTKHEASEAGNDSEKPASEPVSADRLRAIREAVTPGPWKAFDRRIVEMQHRSALAHVSEFYGSKDDAALIALAPDLAEWAADAADALEDVAALNPPAHDPPCEYGVCRPHYLLARLADLVPDPPAE